MTRRRALRLNKHKHKVLGPSGDRATIRNMHICNKNSTCTYSKVVVEEANSWPIPEKWNRWLKREANANKGRWAELMRMNRINHHQPRVRREWWGSRSWLPIGCAFRTEREISPFQCSPYEGAVKSHVSLLVSITYGHSISATRFSLAYICKPESRTRVGIHTTERRPW